MDPSDFLSPKTKEDIEAEYAELPKPYQNLSVADYKRRVKDYLDIHAQDLQIEVFSGKKVQQGLIAKINFGKLAFFLNIDRDGWTITPNFAYVPILDSYQVLGDKPEHVAQLLMDIASRKIALVVYLSDAHEEGMLWAAPRYLPTIGQFYQKDGKTYELLATRILYHRTSNGGGLIEKDGISTMEYDIIHVLAVDAANDAAPKDSTVDLLRENDFSGGTTALQGIPIAMHSLDELNKTGHYTVSYESR